MRRLQNPVTMNRYDQKYLNGGRVRGGRARMPLRATGMHPETARSRLHKHHQHRLESPRVACYTKRQPPTPPRKPPGRSARAAGESTLSLSRGRAAGTSLRSSSLRSCRAGSKILLDLAGPEVLRTRRGGLPPRDAKNRPKRGRFLSTVLASSCFPEAGETSLCSRERPGPFHSRPVGWTGRALPGGWWAGRSLAAVRVNAPLSAGRAGDSWWLDGPPIQGG